MIASQIHEVYAAEEQAAETWCVDPAVNETAAQELTDEAVAWAKELFGIRFDLSVLVEEEVTEAKAAEILRIWEEGGPAAEVTGPLWRDGSPELTVCIYTMVSTDDGHRVGATEHLLLHELAHAVVGEWTPWKRDPDSGAWVLGDAVGPDRHGALFTRRHLDLVERFHPACLPPLADAYREWDIDVAETDADPPSLWNLPRPTPEELRQALDASRPG